MPSHSFPVDEFLSGTVHASLSPSIISGTVTVAMSKRYFSRVSGGTPGNIWANRYSGPREERTTALPVTLSMTYLPCWMRAMPVSGSVTTVVTSGWAMPGSRGMSLTEADDVTDSPTTPSSWMRSPDSSCSSLDFLGAFDVLVATGILEESGTSFVKPASPPPSRIGSFEFADCGEDLDAASSSSSSIKAGARFFFFFLSFRRAERLYKVVAVVIDDLSLLLQPLAADVSEK
mmetsp:Transcript_37750/g.79072  ORF Transcript_37750/g.79072 Transcript_37750/m.79072 type:complete len:232 (+) Transcript_37750:1294-1989(+)